MYTSRFGSYRFQTRQLFKTTAYETHTIGRMQSEMVRFPWQWGAPSSLSNGIRLPHGGRRVAAAAAISRGPASTARPCFVEFTIIGAHVWQYDVCWELLQVSLVIRWHVAERKRRCLNKQTKLSPMEYSNAQQEVDHKQTLTIWNPQMGGDFIPARFFSNDSLASTPMTQFDPFVNTPDY